MRRAAGARLVLGAGSRREEGELGCARPASVLAWSTGSKVRQRQWDGSGARGTGGDRNCWLTGYRWRGLGMSGPKALLQA